MIRWEKPKLPVASEGMSPFEMAVISMMHEVDALVLQQNDQTQRLSEQSQALQAQYKLIRRLEARIRELGDNK